MPDPLTTAYLAEHAEAAEKTKDQGLKKRPEIVSRKARNRK